jgi:hypothetical protein
MQFDVTTGASSVSVYMQNMELILQFMGTLVFHRYGIIVD